MEHTNTTKAYLVSQTHTKPRLIIKSRIGGEGGGGGGGGGGAVLRLSKWQSFKSNAVPLQRLIDRQTRNKIDKIIDCIYI